MNYNQNSPLIKRYSDDWHDIIMSDGVTIKAIYKSIARNENIDICPLFRDFPVIKPERIYGIQIDPAGYMKVVNDRYIIESIVFGEWVERR